jgi:hypothetical protein
VLAAGGFGELAVLGAAVVLPIEFAAQGPVAGFGGELVDDGVDDLLLFRVRIRGRRLGGFRSVSCAPAQMCTIPPYTNWATSPSSSVAGSLAGGRG